MRVLQINPNGSDISALDLHPTISVITGLSSNGRDMVLRAFQAMAQGTDPGCGGLLEAHGVLFDLSAASIGMLDLSVRSGVVVGPDDIAAASVAEAARYAIDFDRAEVDAFIDTTPVGRFPDLDAARNTRDNAREALSILQEAADKAHVKYDEVETSLRRAEADLDVARSSGPRRRFVTEDDADADAADTDVVSADQIRELHAELAASTAELEARAAQIERGLTELSSIDVRPLTVLLEAIKSPSPVELVPSERALELADEVKQLESRVAELEKELDQQGMATEAVMQRLEECRAEVATAERSMKKPELSPEDVEELEAAHEVVLEAEQKASSGLFKGGARKALDDALTRQQAVLDRVGFPTWTAYVMGASLLSIDPIAEQRLEKARLELEVAEDHWARITESIESNPEHGKLLNKLEEVYLEAYDLLGGEEPDDLESALRNVQVARREVTTDELAEALAYQLELIGLPLGDKPSVDLVVMAAETFVDEAKAITGRIAELKAEHAHLDAELADVRLRRAELPAMAELPASELAADLPTWSAGNEESADGPDGGVAPVDGDVADGDVDAVAPVDDFGSFGAFGSYLPDEVDEADGAEKSSDDDSGFAGFASFDSFPSLLGDEDDDDVAAPADNDDLFALVVDDDDATPAENDDLFALVVDDEDEDRAPEVDEDLAADEDVEADAIVAARAADANVDLIADLERKLEIANEEEEEYREWVESRDALVDTALQIGTVANTKLAKLASELLAADHAAGLVAAEGIPDADLVTTFLHDRIGALRHVSFAGSVPLVLDDALRALPTSEVRQVLSQIEPDAASVQIIYLTEDPDLIGWADEVGFQRAAVVDAPAAFR